MESLSKFFTPVLMSLEEPSLSVMKFMRDSEVLSSAIALARTSKPYCSRMLNHRVSLFLLICPMLANLINASAVDKFSFKFNFFFFVVTLFLFSFEERFLVLVEQIFLGSPETHPDKFLCCGLSVPL